MQTDSVPVSGAGHVRESVAACRKAFEEAGLADAWQRVLAVVVHTGADFSPRAVQPYVSERMQPLVAYIRQEDRLVFEAHATDFQTPEALARMVADHCGILKVGPALTYAMREALFALSDIEKDALGGRKGVTLSRLPETMERLMLEDPGFWQAYYQGTEAEQKQLRRNAFSDRIRYYWARPEAEAALQRLMANLRQHPPPLVLLREHLPEAARKIRDGRLDNDPQSIVLDRIAAVAAVYARACRNAAA
jgi:D-tagatose-1,6-bisphosphate aldolase subunit GatZ/KbaZ